MVAGETVPDSQLQQKLAKKLAYDRVGYYDNAFNYLALGVKDGIVTLNGDTVTGVAKDSALAIVARTPGVKDVVNDVTVLPVSDLTIRSGVRTARAIYRDSVLRPLRERSGRPDPHRGGQRTRDALRDGREHDGQEHCRNPGEFCTGRVQRREQAGGGLTGGRVRRVSSCFLSSSQGAAQAAPFFRMTRRTVTATGNNLESHRFCAPGFHLFRKASTSSGASARAFSNSPFFWL